MIRSLLSSKLMSFLTGTMDYFVSFLFSLTSLFAPNGFFFVDGFGDLQSVQQGEKYILQITEGTETVPDLTVEWINDSESRTKTNNKLLHGMFKSPAHFFLPEDARTAHFALQNPSGCDMLKGLVILLAMTGDEGYALRKSLMADDLCKKGYASLLLMMPFYGRRKSPNQSRHFIRTVEHYIKAAQASMLEAASLVRWAHREFPGVPVCVAGLSYGGAMAACAACIAQDPLATVSAIGSDSARVLVTGLISRQVCWASLARDRPGRTRAQVEEELLAVLSAHSVAALADALERRPAALRGGLRRAVCVNAEHDAFVPVGDARALHAAMRRVGRLVGLDPESAVEVEWVPGGHASAVALAAHFVNPAIDRALRPAAPLPH